MPKVLPSHITGAIDNMFGSSRNEIYSQAITPDHRGEVYALLDILDQVPREMLDLSSVDYLELSRCRAVLSTALSRWNGGDNRPVRDVGGKDPVERIRRLMLLCSDEVPPAQPLLPFIRDDDIRLGIEDRLRASWTDFGTQEWMGGTVLAGAALEALLLWALKSRKTVKAPAKPLDQLHLDDLIRFATENNIIGEGTKSQAKLAKDARNLVHPGRALRSGETCNKTTSLTALAAVYRVIDDLKDSA